jgi:hypothetical protein
MASLSPCMDAHTDVSVSARTTAPLLRTHSGMFLLPEPIVSVWAAIHKERLAMSLAIAEPARALLCSCSLLGAHHLTGARFPSPLAGCDKAPPKSNKDPVQQRVHYPPALGKRSLPLVCSPCPFQSHRLPQTHGQYTCFESKQLMRRYQAAVLFTHTRSVLQCAMEPCQCADSRVTSAAAQPARALETRFST